MQEYPLSNCQIEALSFLEGNRYCGLFLPMSSGKTLISLLHINQLGEFPWLIVAPPYVAKYTWKDEIAKWQLPLKIIHIQGSPRERDRLMAREDDANIYIISTYLFADCFNDHLLDQFHHVIVDEISMFRNPTSDRHKAMFKMRHRLNSFIGLTGTPEPNGILSLFGIVRLISSVPLGKYVSHFTKKYMYPSRYVGHVAVDWKPLPGSVDKVHEAIKPYVFSRKLIELGISLKIIDVYVELSDRQMKLYKKFKRKFVLDIDGTRLTASTAGVLCSKLQQLANGAIYDELGATFIVHSEKLDALKDLIIQADSNCLVVYSFRHDLERIKELAIGPEKIKINEFNEYEWNTGQQKAAYLHPQSAAYGINAQMGGSIIIWYGLTWNLELYQQMIYRLYRKGQAKDVRVYRILTRDTIDSRIAQILDEKNDQQEKLMKIIQEEIDTAE